MPTSRNVSSMTTMFRSSPSQDRARLSLGITVSMEESVTSVSDDWNRGFYGAPRPIRPSRFTGEGVGLPPAGGRTRQGARGVEVGALVDTHAQAVHQLAAQP